MSEAFNFEETLASLFEKTFSRCEEWLGTDEQGRTVLVDPHEHQVIGHHYALSHFAAAAILGCPMRSNRFELGVSVLKSVLSRWSQDSATPGFHNDFNNFALVLIHDELERLGICEAERDEIERIVLSTTDSDHDTVNWIPMRLVAEEARCRWGGWSSKALRVQRRKILEAANGDGLIEDRLPRGTSFNLQYDISTVALLDLLETLGIEQPLDVREAFAALAACVLPDGDVNYLGRGCNQIFAWGPWLYLLKRRGDEASQRLAAEFLVPRATTMLENENILLNCLLGKDRDLWWDYHYSSVYAAHFLLWLALARRAESSGASNSTELASRFPESGVLITKSEDVMAVVFSGRHEYLAERGPEVEALWTKRRGIIHKGAFGPWCGAFGNLWSTPSVVLNHFGLLRADGRRGGLRPIFTSVEATILEGSITLLFSAKRPCIAAFNAPLRLEEAAEDISVVADGAKASLKRSGAVVTQYGNETLYQTAPIKATTWQVKIRL